MQTLHEQQTDKVYGHVVDHVYCYITLIFYPLFSRKCWIKVKFLKLRLFPAHLIHNFTRYLCKEGHKYGSAAQNGSAHDHFVANWNGKARNSKKEGCHCNGCTIKDMAAKQH